MSRRKFITLLGGATKRLHRLLAVLPILILVTLGVATAARAYAVAPNGDPEALGFSSSRLARIAAWQ